MVRQRTESPSNKLPLAPTQIEEFGQFGGILSSLTDSADLTSSRHSDLSTSHSLRPMFATRSTSNLRYEQSGVGERKVSED